ncbi:MAG: hypothetical protein LC672_03515, partial [Acidobacteria bacterium]|nr:hypothetical protein [Acidobacteriota bacterium]
NRNRILAFDDALDESQLFLQSRLADAELHRLSPEIKFCSLKIIALKWSSTSDAFTTSNTFTILFIYLVVVVGPVEMWKTDFTVAG